MYEFRSVRTDLKALFCHILRQGNFRSQDLLQIVEQQVKHPDAVAYARAILDTAGHDAHLVAVGRDIFTVPNDGALTPHMRAGNYEPFETMLVENYLRKSDVFLDVGGGLGYYSVLASHRASAVYTIEPLPENLKFIRANLAINAHCDTVKVFDCAASDNNGTVTLYPCHWNAGDNRTWDSGDGRRSLSVQTRKLDDAGIERVNFIKIDTQGNEVRVLRGLEKTIRRQANLSMAVEYWPYGLKNSGNSKEELADILFDWGFRVYQIHDSSFQLRHLPEKRHMTELLDLIRSEMDFTNLWCVKVS